MLQKHGWERLETTCIRQTMFLLVGASRRVRYMKELMRHEHEMKLNQTPLSHYHRNGKPFPATSGSWSGFSFGLAAGVSS
jgi:hypothetical protein